jgi:phosphatidylethanolamine/phosphatidyl-N-methylethanolamine N-methyltransferase
MQALQPDRVLRECVRTYERIAPVYDVLDAAYEWSWKRRLRAELFRHAKGRILDIGVGSGCNLPHYPKGSEVVGIDASAAMLQRAAERAQGLPCEASFAQMNLLELGFADRTFDTVVATFVLLCLPEQLQLPALRELRRVCRPDGAVLILDYRMSEDPAMRLLMRCMSPWLRWAFHGRYDAFTEHYVEAAGLRPVRRRTHMREAVALLTLEPQIASS